MKKIFSLDLGSKKYEYPVFFGTTDTKEEVDEVFRLRYEINGDRHHFLNK